MQGHNRGETRRRSVGKTLLVIFFAAGALICLVTILALAFPGGFLEPIWRLKPEARVEFQQIGYWSVALMAVIGTACGLAAVGLAKSAEWGRRVAIGVLSLNLVGDSLNAWLRHDSRTLIGLPIGGLMIAYLMRKKPSALHSFGESAGKSDFSAEIGTQRTYRARMRK